MSLMLSIDEQILVRVQQLAQQRGTSLNELIQNYLQTLAASNPAEDVAELERLWMEEEGDSHGWKWNRGDI
ncbi:MAG TPA: DUF6364 family protein [Thermoanaerobaculia bacterium]|nr:DUF6364 family protein [Thermoanaerobaculia bacterium]